MELELGLSPCPNDTYIFHALLHGLVETGDLGSVRPYFADVQELNRAALKRKLPVTKISAGVLPYIIDDYAILASGGALGWGCGPLVVTRNEIADLSRSTIAIPGRHTTANHLLDLHGGFHGPRKEMLFSEIMPAVASGEADAGIIIHEGRFTYPAYGLRLALDMGEWWESENHLPLPLGVIAIRRDLADAIGTAIENAISASCAFANANPEASKEFIRGHAQELDEAVTRAHIRTFVNDYSLALGEEGKSAIRSFLAGAGCGQRALFLSDQAL